MSICQAGLFDPQAPPQGFTDEKRLVTIMRHVSNRICDGMTWNLEVIENNLKVVADRLSDMAIDWKDTVAYAYEKIRSMNNVHNHEVLAELGCCMFCMPMEDFGQGLPPLDALDSTMLPELTGKVPLDLPDVATFGLPSAVPLDNNAPMPLLDLNFNFSEDLQFAPSDPKASEASEEPEYNQPIHNNAVYFKAAYYKDRKKKAKGTPPKKRQFTYKHDPGHFAKQRCNYIDNYNARDVHNLITKRLAPTDFSSGGKKFIKLFTQLLLHNGRATYSVTELKRFMKQCGAKPDGFSKKNFCLVAEHRYQSTGCPTLECINPNAPNSELKFQLHPEYWNYADTHMRHLKSQVTYDSEGNVATLTWCQR